MAHRIIVGVIGVEFSFTLAQCSPAVCRVVVGHPVHATAFVDDAVGDAAQEGVVERVVGGGMPFKT